MAGALTAVYPEWADGHLEIERDRLVDTAVGIVVPPSRHHARLRQTGPLPAREVEIRGCEHGYGRCSTSAPDHRVSIHICAAQLIVDAELLPSRAGLRAHPAVEVADGWVAIAVGRGRSVSKSPSKTTRAEENSSSRTICARVRNRVGDPSKVPIRRLGRPYRPSVALPA